MQTRHVPTIDEQISLPEVSDARIAPGGDRVAYVVRTPNWERNAYMSQIWVADVSAAPSTSRPLTSGAYSSHTPRWSPDGRWLSCLSHPADEPGPVLSLLSPQDAREPRQLVTLPTYGWAFSWSPDSQSIAYIGFPQEDDQAREREACWGHVRIVDQDVSVARLWLVSVEDGRCRSLNPDCPLHVTGFDWHPDGGRIAFSACPTSKADDWDRGQLYLVDVATEVVTDLPGQGVSHPRWSPDGARLAFSRCGTPSYIATNALCVLEVAQRRVRALDAFGDDSHLLDWGPEGLYALAVKGATCHMFCVDPEQGKPRRLTPDQPLGFAITEGWIGLGCDLSRDFSRAAFVSYDADHCAEVTVLDTHASTVRHLTTATADIGDWQLGRAELFRWQSPDGVSVEGILTKPSGFDPAKRYPLVVVIHGGPTHTSFLPPLSDGDYWYCAIPQLVGKGALVLQPNYRGSSGYGDEFRTLNVGTLGLSEYLDIISGVDALIERGWVDGERVGAIGMSHGGYLAAFAASYTRRFAAAAVISGISDWALNYYTTDTRDWMRQYLHAAPWEDPEAYRAASPLTYVPHAETPILFLHGERDDRAPIANAHALYRGLKERDVDARMVVYPEMGHGISKPREFRHLMQEVVNWFDRWLWQSPA